MTITINANDSIHIPSLNTGSTVGNGGDGYSYGNIVSKPVFNFNPTNTATGSTNDVDSHKVHSSIDANTIAHQSNHVSNDQSQTVMTGNGGNGGSDNILMDSGNVSFDLGSHIHV